jgi:hypothetical protein
MKSAEMERLLCEGILIWWVFCLILLIGARRVIS